MKPTALYGATARREKPSDRTIEASIAPDDHLIPADLDRAV
jgi:hypothetical protein